ncbi:MAG: hypothetical protein IAG13_04470 [Deltaproteobacteria bacterium]|nr:hypothetical protein [Nannocystaceae bacterium]
MYSDEAIEGVFDPSIAGELIDWDDLPRLVDFSDPPPGGEPTFATTWLSFEIVDEWGRPADGTFTCTIDNAPHGAALARRLHSFDGLRAGARAQLSARVAFDADRPEPSKPQPVTPDPEWPVAPRDPDPQGVSFEVVDDEGRLLLGGYVLDDAGATHTGQLGRMTVVPARNAARLQLSVDWSASRSGASA